MKQLNKPTDNMGGLLKIWAVPPGDITVNNGYVNFGTMDNIVEIYCTPGTLSFTEKEGKSRGGTYYDAMLKAFIPKDSPESQEIINDMSRRKWVLIYIDQNEYWKVAGTSQIPLRCSFDLDTGTDTQERNGHGVSFFGQQISKARFVADPFK